MKRSLLGGAVSFAMTCATAPAVRQFLVRRGALDVPNHRSSHTTPVPRGGGLACLAGVATGLALAGRRSSIPARVIGGVAVLTATGLADDALGHVHHTTRLAAQSGAGLLIAPTVAAVPASAIATAGVVNVVNFMDGINGITGSTAAVWGLATLMTGRKRLDPGLQTLGAVTAGAGLGFLPWNAPHAQLFLGDVGSYLFGGLMAAGIVQAAPHRGTTWRVAAPLLPYGVDAAQAILGRARRGQPLTEAHRDHVYQRLVDRHGHTHTTVAAIHAVVASAIARAACAENPWLRVTVPPLLSLAYISLPAILPQSGRATT